MGGLSWCPSWSNSLWQRWGCGLVHCPGGNATDPIWRVLASSLGISSWTSLNPLHSNPNPLANQLGCIDFLTPPTPLIIPHRLPAFLESLMPLKNWGSIHARCSTSSLKHSIRFCGIIFFPSLKQNFIAYRSSKVSSRPDCIFEVYQLWQSGFSRMYSNCCCSCWFEPEIIKIGQSSHKMYSNNILTFQDSTTILNAYTKKSGNLLKAPRIYIYIYIHSFLSVCLSLSLYIHIYIYIITEREKGMNSSLLLLSWASRRARLDSLTMLRQLVKGKVKSVCKPAVLRSKINLVLYSSHEEKTEWIRRYLLTEFLCPYKIGSKFLTINIQICETLNTKRIL